MNKKAEELVEWVAHQLYDCKDKEVRREDWDSMALGIKAFYIGQYQWLIERILSHPDIVEGLELLKKVRQGTTIEAIITRHRKRPDLILTDD